MKKILLSLALIAGFTAHSQTVNVYVDTPFSNDSHCNISPIIIGNDTITMLKVKTFDDNQVTFAGVYFAAMTSSRKIIIDGNLYLSPTEYAAWVDKNYIYNYVANKKGYSIAR